MVSPTTLIPVAEQSHLIVDIGRWVLQRAWDDRYRAQGERGADELAMSVNVSTYQFMSAGFADSVALMLEPGLVDPRLLTLEVTESIFACDGERALVVLNELKELGVTLALDDFGAGYSSLAYLKRFPVDVIKMDRSFVAGLQSGPAGYVVVDAIIQLAHGLGMTVIAEGVETVEQHQELGRLGCDSCQGFLFSPPMPLDSLDMQSWFVNQPHSGRAPQEHVNALRRGKPPTSAPAILGPSGG